MLVPQLLGLELGLVVLLVDLFEDILESAVVALHDGVLSAHVEWIASLQGVLEAGMREAFDGLVSVVHAHQDTRPFELVDRDLFGFSFLRSKGHRESAWFAGNHILRSVLVSKGMSANDDRLSPAWNESRDVVDHDGLPEHSAVQLVSNGAIGTLPHLFESKLFDSRLVWSDGGALNADLVLLDGVGSIQRDLVIGLVSLLDA